MRARNDRRLVRAAWILGVVVALTAAGCAARQPPAAVKAAPLPSVIFEQFVNRLRTDRSASLALEVPGRRAEDSFAFTVRERPIPSSMMPAAIFARGVGAKTGAVARLVVLSSSDIRLAVFDRDSLYVARAVPNQQIDYQPARAWPDRSGRTCSVTPRDVGRPRPPVALAAAAPRPPGVLRRFQMAVATTPALRVSYSESGADLEYDIVSVIDAANEVFNRDLGVELVLAGPSLTADAIDLGQEDSLTTLHAHIVTLADAAKQTMDLGHLFDAGGGGRALIGKMCSPTERAGAFSRGPESISVGNFIHEAGHQLGALHSFNKLDAGRQAAGAFEPGEGISIMSRGYGDHYYFHASSMQFVTTAVDAAGTCGETFTESADVPVVDVVKSEWHVPANTPFELAAVKDASVKTYRWDEYDLGPVPNARPPFFASSSEPGDSRIYPFLDDLLSGKHSWFWPWPRTMVFRVLGFSADGNRRSKDVTVHVAAGFNKFRVSKAQCASECRAGSVLKASWKHADTFQPPISVTTLRAEILEIAGGKPVRWYPIAGAAALDNQSGTAAITLPADLPAMAEARLVLKANQGIFLALSDRIVIAPPK
jgi:hypothetical protein